MKPGLLLYRFAIKTLAAATKLAAAFNPKAKLFMEGRSGIFEKLERALFNRQGEKRVWFHCASLGEFEQGRPVMERFKAAFPEYELFLTFYSPSGYEVRKNYDLAQYIFYLPLDSPGNAKKFLDLVSPHLAFFIKYEFWYYYLTELKKRGVPVLSISAIFRPDQLFFKSYGGFYKEMLHCFTHIFVQNMESLHLLQKAGVQAVSLSGDTRFDRVVALVDHRKEVPLVAKFQNGKAAMVVGSSWSEDMEVLMPFINRNAYELKFIIAPHEISEANIEAIQSATNLSVARFSQADLATVSEFDILIIDNVGLLSSLYYYGDYAYIGGAFGKGLHNILEAATYGIPVIFGNKSYSKFQEAKDLIALGGAFPVGDEKTLNKVFYRLSNYSVRQKAGEINESYVNSHTGATEKILAYCTTLLN